MMDRDGMIARILRAGRDCPHVLAALPTWTLERMAGADRCIGILPGETGPHSVYRLTFPDGAYIGMTGMTGRFIIKRIEQHFGVAGSHDGGPRFADMPLRERWELALGTERILARLAAGMTCSAECLHSGLSRDDARTLEADAIARHGGQLGMLADEKPELGAVARLRYGAGT